MAVLFLHSLKGAENCRSPSEAPPIEMLRLAWRMLAPRPALRNLGPSVRRWMMAAPPGPDDTILDRLRAHAQVQPDRLAYRFLRDQGGSDTLTFGQLDLRVRGL